MQAGDLAQLRAAVPQRFVTVRYRGSAPEWPLAPSIDVVDQRDGEVRLRDDPNADLASLVASAQRETDLVAFAFEPPTLSELFREAVAA